MRILVCGGRNYRNSQFLGQVLSDLTAENISQGDPVTIIHGAARGADEMAGAWAMSNRLNMEVYAANWNEDGRAAGPIRNARMLAEGKPDLVVAFSGGRGTADMIAKARRAGVPVHIVGEPQ